MTSLGCTSCSSSAQALTTASTARAADGDYKVPNAASSAVKDADGDYRPLALQPAASSAVQAALTAIKLGG
jgi:hypothetical protein